VTSRCVRVQQIVIDTPWSAVVRLDLGASAFAFRAGQAATLGRSAATTKPYSIASSPDSARRDRAVEFLIGVKSDGTLGSHLASLTVGSMVWLGQPFGTFGLPKRLTVRRLLLIAGGTGVAPLRSVLHSALGARTPPAITLLYSAQSADGFAFVREFRQLSRAGRMRLRLTVTREAGPRWRGRRGRIQTSWLGQELRAGPTLCLVCGPPGFVEDVCGKLKSLGVPPSRIKREAH